ncbi:MAG: TlpA family protein disulfide reductase [Acidobacteria bacterium]|nr:TlpA family protein disulfide reductase [Acidobacteriota bacterium]
MARRLLILALFVVGVGLIAFAGVHNLRSRKAAMQKAQESEVVLTKADAPADAGADPEAQPMLGKIAPQFTLVDVSGKKVSLSQFKGHPIVMNFWATYCGPCRLEMPWFQQLEGKYQAQGLVVLGLDQDEGMATREIADAAKKVGVSYPILLPDDKVASSYQLGDYLPETIYIDKNGKVVDQTVGAHSKDELEADIQKAIGAGAA